MSIRGIRQSIAGKSVLGRLGRTSGTAEVVSLTELAKLLKSPGGGSVGVVNLIGDVTGAGAGVITTSISAGVVTYAKIQNISTTNRLLGRKTAGAGSPEEITVGGDITQSGSTFALVTSGVTAGIYPNATVTVDAKGRVTSAVSGNMSGIIVGQDGEDGQDGLPNAGLNYSNSVGTFLQGCGVWGPAIVPLAPLYNIVIPTDCGIIFPDRFEIGASNTIELVGTSVMELT